MQLLSNLLEKREVKKNGGKKKINVTWEKAQEFGIYVGLSTPFVLRLFKKFGEAKVLNLRSELKDLPDKKRIYGFVVWKLKQ